MKKSFRSILSLIMVLALLSSFVVTAAAEDIAEGVTVSINTSSVGTNNGTVTANKGSGTIDLNNGTIGTPKSHNQGNKATVNTNGEDGIIYDNQSAGKVKDNYGTIETNKGTVTFNNEGGSVTNNAKGGEVRNNKGEVVENDGTVINNKSTGVVQTNNGQVDNNHAKVDTNNGTVDYNGANGVVQTNASDGDIKNNYGAVKENYGDIKNNKKDGEVGKNYGTITNNLNGGVVEENSWFKDDKGNEVDGIIENNEGVVNVNDGVIQNNKDGGVVRENNWEIKENNGTVITNNDGVEENNGTINTNNWDVSENNGTVIDNVFQRDEDGTIVSWGDIYKNKGTVKTNSGGVYENTGTVETNYGVVENLAGGTIGDDETLKLVDEGKGVEQDAVKEEGYFYGVEGIDGETSVLVQIKEDITASLQSLFGFKKDGYTVSGYTDAYGTEYKADAEVKFDRSYFEGKDTSYGFKFFAQWLKNVVKSSGSDDSKSAPQAKIYKVIENEEDAKNGKFTIDVEKTKLKGVYVDGKFVEPENYTISADAQGRLEITFTAEYLATLATGEHTVWVNLTDGGATFKLIIE